MEVTTRLMDLKIPIYPVGSKEDKAPATARVLMCPCTLRVHRSLIQIQQWGNCVNKVLAMAANKAYSVPTMTL